MDQDGLRVEGEEKAAMIVREQALPEGGGEAQSRPAEDRGDPGQSLQKVTSGEQGLFPGGPSENPVTLAAGPEIQQGIVRDDPPEDPALDSTGRRPGGVNGKGRITDVHPGKKRENPVHYYGLCKALHKPYYAEFEIMLS